ncbi:MAG: VWA domain-containing protein [Myxococcales bacterium]|nr:VWA domain-containing protein [Myxococcales bacterium]
MDRDFVLLIEPRDAKAPTAQVARGPDGAKYAMVTFLPEPGRASAPRDVVFVLDCSGSMHGESIEQARLALELCVRALDEGDRFDIVRFGSTHERLFGAPRPFDEATMAEAIRYARASEADLGGTEILGALQDVIPSGPPDEARPRAVLVLTDGAVANETDVIRLAAAHAECVTIFPLAIGSAASHYLTEELARVTRGRAETVFAGERIEPKVLRTFGRIRQRGTRAHIETGDARVTLAPAETPPAVRGEPLTALLRLDEGHTDAVALVLEDERLTVPIDLERPAEGGPIPTLWARERIRELERTLERPRTGSRAEQRQEDAARARLLEVALAHQLSSAITSWVAVVERAPGERAHGEPERCRIALQLPRGSSPTPSAATRGRRRLTRESSGRDAVAGRFSLRAHSRCPEAAPRSRCSSQGHADAGAGRGRQSVRRSAPERYATTRKRGQTSAGKVSALTGAVTRPRAIHPRRSARGTPGSDSRACREVAPAPRNRAYPPAPGPLR